MHKLRNPKIKILSNLKIKFNAWIPTKYYPLYPVIIESFVL